MSTTQIKPKLRTFDLTIIVISLVVGMGIFRTPAEVAANAGTPTVFYVAWIAGCLVSLCGALTFAEIGSRFPAAGGFYKIFSHCYSPKFAFMVNWITVISNAASVAAVALIGSAYIADMVFPELPEQTASQIISVAMVVVLLFVNLLGIKVSAKVLSGLMILKIILILILTSAVFFVAKDHFATIETPTPPADYNPYKAFILCFMPVFFTFGGYQLTINFGGDVQNPNKTIPKSIFIGIAVILTLYIGVNYSYINVLGIEGLASSTTIASDMMEILMGPEMSTVLGIIMFFAVITYVNVSILANPRTYYAMAEDGVMPKSFMKVNPKTQVQINGVLLFCAFVLITLFFMDSFSKILMYVMFFDSIAFITAVASIFILRKRAKENPPKGEIYRFKGYPILPAFFILVYATLNISVFIANPAAFGYGAILFLSGLPLYYLIKKLLIKNDAQI
jgi:APA family basic amino acid/polyamine antiporter